MGGQRYSSERDTRCKHERQFACHSEIPLVTSKSEGTLPDGQNRGRPNRGLDQRLNTRFFKALGVRRARSVAAGAAFRLSPFSFLAAPCGPLLWRAGGRSAGLGGCAPFALAGPCA